jgi:hypothetical protein
MTSEMRSDVPIEERDAFAATPEPGRRDDDDH